MLELERVAIAVTFIYKEWKQRTWRRRWFIATSICAQHQLEKQAYMMQYLNLFFKEFLW